MRDARTGAAFSGSARSIGLLAVACLAAAGPVSAQDAPPARHACFYANQFRDWKAPDARTIYIRVDPHRYYRLDMAGECQSLLWPDSHLITHVRGSNSICSALDWDLQVSQWPHGIPQSCIVRTMTELSPAEAAAIPPKFKP